MPDTVFDPFSTKISGKDQSRLPQGASAMLLDTGETEEEKRRKELERMLLFNPAPMTASAALGLK